MFVAAPAVAAIWDGGNCRKPRCKLFGIRRSSAQMTTAMFSGLVHAVRLIIGLCGPRHAPGQLQCSLLSRRPLMPSFVLSALAVQGRHPGEPGFATFLGRSSCLRPRSR